MKLKPIPKNTVVHTPTEEEVRELFAILHENGWISTGSENYVIKNAEGIQINSDINWSWWGKIEKARKANRTILTLAEFKEKYVEEEKPQPKFKVEDLEESDLELYTEPETKPTEDMGENKEINKELNLCELLEGHEGETLFSLAHGDVKLDHVSPTIDSCIVIKKRDGDIERFYRNGRWLRDGIVMLFPSRALYEQYPLEPYKAWMVWREEQERSIHIKVVKVESGYTEIYQNLYFRTPSDRDKCIKEINAVIEKYQK